MNVRGACAALAVAVLSVGLAGCGGSGGGGGKEAGSGEVKTVDELVSFLKDHDLCPSPEPNPGYTSLSTGNPAEPKVTKTVECNDGEATDVVISGFANTADRDFAAKNQHPAYFPYVGTGDNLWLIQMRVESGRDQIIDAIGADQARSLG